MKSILFNRKQQGLQTESTFVQKERLVLQPRALHRGEYDHDQPLNHSHTRTRRPQIILPKANLILLKENAQLSA